LAGANWLTGIVALSLPPQLWGAWPADQFEQNTSFYTTVNQPPAIGNNAPVTFPFSFFCQED
jgi:hypothetical protein